MESKQKELYTATKILGVYTEEKKYSTRRATVSLELRITDETHNGGVKYDWETLMPVANPIGLSVVGNIKGLSCGQNIEECVDLFPTPENIRIREIWREYHLNTLHAGTRVQELFINNYFKVIKKKQYDFTEAVEALKKAGLYPDTPYHYKYGHSWLYQPIPEDIIREVKMLFSGERL